MRPAAPRPAAQEAVVAVVAAGAVVALGALTAACAEPDFGVPHPSDRFSYPVAVSADPSGETLWVVSGNFDVAYRGGAVLGIDIATRAFIPGAAVEIGGFPGPLSILGRDGAAVAGYALSRQDDALYHIEMGVDPQTGQPTLDCEGSRLEDNGVRLCRKKHAIDTVEVKDMEGEDHELSVGPDPFGALVHHARMPLGAAGAGGATADADAWAPEPDLLLTGAMIGGNVATFRLDESGAPEMIANLDLEGGVYAFAENPKTGRIYTSSKSVGILHVLRVDPPDPDTRDLLRADAESGGELPIAWDPTLHHVADIVVPTVLGGDQTRSMAVSSDGSRLYAAYRTPPSVLVVDVGEGSTGIPAGRVISQIPVGLHPADLLVAPSSGGAPELVYVSCFGDDRIDIIDPVAGARTGMIPTGDGPFGMTLNDTATERRLYVANFYDHTIGVVELDPASPYHHVQVAEIR